MLEAIALCEEISGPDELGLRRRNRIGDHIWYVSDLKKFQADYPDWKFTVDLREILVQIHDGISSRL